MKKAPAFVLLSSLLVGGYGYTESVPIQFAYIGGETDSALLGVRQGLMEANLQGRFLGQQDYTLAVFPTRQWQRQDLSDFIGLLTAGDNALLLAIGNAYPNTPVFNLAGRDNSLRTDCHTNLLHIIPSQQMLDDAVAQWRQKQPDSVAVVARAWHSDFKKFAARDLNKRFLRHRGIGMDDYAWAGWAAIKMASDVAARRAVTRADAMLHHLKTDLSFDGQKGSIMNFRVTGQLRQLLLLVEGNDIVAEAPVRGIASPPGLDSLGVLDCEK